MQKAFALFHWMGEYLGMLSIFIAAILIMVPVAYRPMHRDDWACYGHLGIGIPVAFICDHSAGGSPLSSAGRIDLNDYPFFSVQGLLFDLLVFSLPLFAAWMTLRWFFQRPRAPAS